MEANYLQYMVGFAIHRHESTLGVHVSHHPEPPSTHSPPHPSGLSQSTGFGCPAPCIKFVLVICFTYGNIHVSILFSQIIPPSPEVWFLTLASCVISAKLLMPSKLQFFTCKMDIMILFSLLCVCSSIYDPL